MLNVKTEYVRCNDAQKSYNLTTTLAPAQKYEKCPNQEQ